MGFTTNYQIPYPELTDIPDGAGQMKALATQVDVKVKGIDDRLVVQEVGGPAVQVTATAIQSIATGAYTAVNFDAEDFDATAMHDLVANTSRLVCKKAGVYLACGGIPFAANATGRRGAAWFIGGTQAVGAPIALQATATGTCYVPAPTCYLKLTVNQYVELQAWQDSGAALNTAPSTYVRASAALCWVMP